MAFQNFTKITKNKDKTFGHKTIYKKQNAYKKRKHFFIP